MSRYPATVAMLDALAATDTDEKLFKILVPGRGIKSITPETTRAWYAARIAACWDIAEAHLAGRPREERIYLWRYVEEMIEALVRHTEALTFWYRFSEKVKAGANPEEWSTILVETGRFYQRVAGYERAGSQCG